MRITPERARHIFRDSPPPKIVWEKQFDGFDAELRKLARQDWREIADSDLWYYLHDLSYVKLQPNLFTYLFPVCLNFWYQSLMRNESAECGDAEFHYSLRQGKILEKMCTADQAEQVYDFFHDGLIDRIETERGFVYADSSTPAHAWIHRLNALGYISPIVGRIWASWWQLDHPGKAVSAIMYSSGLVYLKGENPIFGVWTRERGGGGPYLTESHACIYDTGWLESNLRFLKQTLSVTYIQDRLLQAAQGLRNEPEAKLAEKIAIDASHRPEVIQIRIDDLIKGLSKPSPATWGRDD